MPMGEILVRLEGVPEELLEKIMKEGYYKTKTEAIRAAIIELGKEYGLIGNPAYYREQLQKIVREKPFTEAEIKRELAKLEEG